MDCPHHLQPYPVSVSLTLLQKENPQKKNPGHRYVICLPKLNCLIPTFLSNVSNLELLTVIKQNVNGSRILAKHTIISIILFCYLPLGEYGGGTSNDRDSYGARRRPERDKQH